MSHNKQAPHCANASSLSRTAVPCEAPEAASTLDHEKVVENRSRKQPGLFSFRSDISNHQPLDGSRSMFFIDSTDYQVHANLEQPTEAERHLLADLNIPYRDQYYRY
ncbi:hypothetical protein SAMN06265795_104288 [Noviherbaspirillum humi]|uniref:Uncharacterized protein n=1 Tax=Noviherbaspirillum humi TaxID=1688639 RepID=A0A239G7U9_9BURK|nr:hypothetical protein [Noviherbaspirillum humi]SNS65180.1 hypothetical protein SAMN06265795_104288 [Noviherbaspirillum humi]